MLLYNCGASKISTYIIRVISLIKGKRRRKQKVDEEEEKYTDMYQIYVQIGLQNMYMMMMFHRTVDNIHTSLISRVNEVFYLGILSNRTN